MRTTVCTLDADERRSDAIDRFSCCLADVEAWMTASRLRLNATKTQLLWLGSRYSVDRLTIRELNALGSVVRMVDSARDLGVVVDSRLTIADHIASVCRANCGKFDP